VSPLEIYAAQARYNRWMNDRLYAAAAKLTDEERRAPKMTREAEQ
jgi:uncharacterized damage-inducible protein DinB